MDNISGLVAFVRAAENKSFVAAGRDLGISASAVGKNIARLEERLGARLFHRTTRSVNLTEEGALFYERCRQILADLDAAQDMLLSNSEQPRGKLRVTLPTIGYRFLLPALPGFLERYPEIELDLDFNDRIIDIVDEGKDAAIRSGGMADSRFMARRLGSFRFVICASPSYLERHGMPKTPTDLASHSCLQFRFPSTGKLQEWTLVTDAVAARVKLKTGLICNNMEAVLAGAVGGIGLAYMPTFLASDALERGRLEIVLDAFMGDPSDFWVVWPSNQHLSPRLRVFIDFLVGNIFKER